MVDIHGHRGEFDLEQDNNGETVKLLDPRSLVAGGFMFRGEAGCVQI